MKVFVAGIGHLAKWVRHGAVHKGFEIAPPEHAALIFYAEDTPVFPGGARDQSNIRANVNFYLTFRRPLVVASQVEPGFCRSFGRSDLFHQADILRTNDEIERSERPEMLIVGSPHDSLVSPSYEKYLQSFACPVMRMEYEEAEFAKIAINCTLASQVENTNRLAEAAKKVGAGWQKIADVLRHDKRIGKHAYLSPGDWRQSPHLLRDQVSLEEILAR